MRHNPFVALCVALLCAPLAFGLGTETREIMSSSFGAVGDGVTDDGPAIRRMLEAARGAETPTRLVFDERRTYRVETGHDRYAFWLEGFNDLEIDGAGSTFLLAPDLRMMHAEGCENLVVRGLNVDFSPLPFVEGTVASVDLDARSIVVALDEPATDDTRPGPATDEDGEQDFFAMAWSDGPYEVDYARHFYVGDVEPACRRDLRWSVPLLDGHGFDLESIDPGTTRFTLPVPGIAHRYGPGHLFWIGRNRDVLFEDVEIWSAPWFGFGVFKNEGDIVFRRAHVRPKPGSGRTTSTWRDAYHIKHNRGEFLMESCVISGCHDDAIHIAAHPSTIVATPAPDRVDIRQNFPLEIAPYRPGDLVTSYDPETGARSEPVRVTEVRGVQQTVFVEGEPTSPILTLVLEEPLDPAIPERTVIWNDSSANPRATIRGCVVDQSCRFRGPITIEDSDFRSLIWIYGEWIEAPIPTDVVLRNSRFDRGRGNDDIAISLQGYTPVQPQGTDPAMSGFLLENSVVRGGVAIRDAKELRFVDTLFAEDGATIELTNVRDVRFDGCSIAGSGPVGLHHLDVETRDDKRQIRIKR